MTGRLYTKTRGAGEVRRLRSGSALWSQHWPWASYLLLVLAIGCGLTAAYGATPWQFGPLERLGTAGRRAAALRLTGGVFCAACAVLAVLALGIKRYMLASPGRLKVGWMWRRWSVERTIHTRGETLRPVESGTVGNFSLYRLWLGRKRLPLQGSLTDVNTVRAFLADALAEPAGTEPAEVR